jgi:hypothetical protein
MDELVAFLRARLDTDGRRALAAPKGPWEPALVTRGSGFDEWAIYGELGTTSRWSNAKGADEQLPQRRMIAGPGYEGGGVQGEAAARHIARHNPTRVLAEVEAKRQLLADALAEKHTVVEDCWYTCPAATEERDGGETCNDADSGKPCNCGRDARVEQRLRLLAMSYADHPDHREEWRP